MQIAFELVRSLGRVAIVAALLSLSCAPNASGPSSPSAAASEPYARPSMAATRTRLSNGIGVTVLPRPGSASTAVELLVPTVRDYGEGSVSLMAESLRAGTRCEGCGGVVFDPTIGGQPIFIGSTPGGSVFRWDAPVATEGALKVLSSFLLAPMFEPAQVKVQLDLALDRIRRNRGTPWHLRELAFRALPGFERLSFTEDAENASKLTPEILRAIHRCTMRPDEVEVVVVGPVDSTQVTEQVELALGSWRSATAGDEACAWPTSPSSSEGKELQNAKLAIVRAKGDPFITIALPGPEYASEEYWPLILVDTVLRHRYEGLSLRRLQRASSPPVDCGVFDATRKRSAFVVQGQFGAEQARGALRAMLSDIRKLAQTLGEEELLVAKRSLRDDQIKEMSANANAADFVISRLREGRDPTNLADWPEQVMQIDLERCRRAAERYLSKAMPSIVVTGVDESFANGLAI